MRQSLMFSTVQPVPYTNSQQWKTRSETFLNTCGTELRGPLTHVLINLSKVFYSFECSLSSEHPEKTRIMHSKKNTKLTMRHTENWNTVSRTMLWVMSLPPFSSRTLWSTAKMPTYEPRYASTVRERSAPGFTSELLNDNDTCNDIHINRVVGRS